MSKHLIVIIDAGHGNNTPGKRTPDGMREYEFNKATALYLESMLELQYKNVTVYHVYDKGGADVSLTSRTNKANQIYAKYRSKVHAGTHEVCLISIHANAFGSGWNSARGIETYSWNGHSPNSDALAKTMQSALIDTLGLYDRGAKKANLHMVREPDFTSILVELGFMTNKEEATLLKSDAYRHKCAVAIINGLNRHYGLEKKPTPKSVDKAKKPAKIQTGGLNADMCKDVAEYFINKGWYAEFKFDGDGNPVALTGGLSPDMQKEFESWLKAKNWWYKVV